MALHLLSKYVTTGQTTLNSIKLRVLSRDQSERTNVHTSYRFSNNAPSQTISPLFTRERNDEHMLQWIMSIQSYRFVLKPDERYWRQLGSTVTPANRN
ncbi:hypothetical protein J6590_036117 [Homalodisca vitripennis]|nr:hypothetical protein J6590_036117 [Homalodisca vitripennis]